MKIGYASGFLDRYRELEQLAHYMVIVGYCHCFNRSAAILDVGCVTRAFCRNDRSVH